MEWPLLQSEYVRAISLSLALGVLVGIQRGWTLRNALPGTRFAGIRTYGLLGLAGGLAGILQTSGPALATIILVGAAALILIGYARSTGRGENISGTASLTSLITLGCGYLAGRAETMAATATAVATLLLLSARTPLHKWIAQLEEAEVNAIARFALIAIVILPLLPDETYGPFDAWNPRKLWWIVVIVSGLSFAGYIASKYWGSSRGTIATAAAGAMVSSTAVTATMASRLRDRDENTALLTAAITVATTIMFLRVLVLTALLMPYALPATALLIGPAALISGSATLYFLRSASRAPISGPRQLFIRNPFSVRSALILVGSVMLVSVLSRWAMQHYGNMGLSTLLAITGAADVDAAIMTMASLPDGTITARSAGFILVAPVILNTVLKAVLAVSFAGWTRGWRPMLVLLTSISVTAITLGLLI